MNRSLLLLTLALTPVASMASLIVTVEDLNAPGTLDVFCDQNYGAFCDNVSATAGTVVFDNTVSPVLGAYWQGSAVVSLSNYVVTPPENALLGSALFSLNALQTGTNVAINVAGVFDTPAGPPITFESTANASTLNDAAYDFAVLVNGNLLQNELGVTDTGTFQASGTYDVSAPFTITQTFRPTALATGADVGIDFSTQAVPEPQALALLGLGLLGLVGVQKLRKQ